jgi:hypothetical protein
MALRISTVAAALALIGSLPTDAAPQINVTKTGYYLSLGDSRGRRGAACYTRRRSATLTSFQR